MIFNINSHKHSVPAFIKGTLILTAAGLISRLIGFFYRIYLSRCFGEENIGIYQLITPVISLGFSLCAAGYQTAVSKLAAEAAAGCTSPYSVRSPESLSMHRSLFPCPCPCSVLF